MVRRKLAAFALFCVVLAPILSFAQQPTAPPPPKDPNDPIERIKDEGMNRSQVMQTLSYLSDVIGPRLTGSPGLLRANNWTKDQLTKWGLENAHLEAWGPFGRGWALQSFSAEVSAPLDIPLIAYPKAWTLGTNGELTADVVYLDATDIAGLEKYRGQLKGKIVLDSPVRKLDAHFDPQGTRDTEKDLLKMADAPETVPQPRGPRPPGDNPQFRDAQRAARFAATKLWFLQQEGAAMVVDISRAGDGGTIFVQQVTVPMEPAPETAPGATPAAPRPRVNGYDKNVPAFAPQMVMSAEHYNRIVRMLQAGEKVQIKTHIDVKFYDDDPMAYNTIAEIPGTDLKDEIVMLGGHMDSWHAGTGATDNGAGVAVAMEAVRILKALGLQPRRTIRVALWSGEEEGLLGSRAYVAQHFGKLDPPPTPNFGGGPPAADAPKPKLLEGPEYEKLSGYFNLDNGTGKVRGVYLQGNDQVRWTFSRWLQPFRDMGAETLTISNTGGTDHLSFDGIGLPGFQFIQDEIEYSSRTHHSNQDVFDRIQADDLKQAAIIEASFVYQTAMMDQKLPRKTKPGQ
jgi:carboxypeptidase Q